MACTGSWWLNLNYFFFFAGVSCYWPFLTAHLKWLGFELLHVGVLHSVPSIGSALAAAVVAGRCCGAGFRTKTAALSLLAAFSLVGMLLVPRLERSAEPPPAQVLCGPHGSLLWAGPCGGTCHLGAKGRAQITLSECRFEQRSVSWQQWLITDSQPERGDLPANNNQSQLVVDDEELDQVTVQTAEDYSYDQEHDYPETQYNETRVRRQQDELALPHICIAGSCRVMVATDNLLLINTSLAESIRSDDLCLYPLRDDGGQEIQCRTYEQDQQIRCHVGGLESLYACERVYLNWHSTFWLYVVFRTCTEIGLIGAAILMFGRQSQETDQVKCQVANWMFGIAGALIFTLVSGIINDLAGFSMGFLLGSTLFGSAAFTIALSPVTDNRLWDSSSNLARQLRTLCTTKFILVLLLVQFFGICAAVVQTTFYWYLVESGVSRLHLGMTTFCSIVPSILIFAFRNWLLNKYGLVYIQITGLLLYSIRFCAYCLVQQATLLVPLELLEPTAWILITTAINIDRAQQAGVDIVNIWILIILSHYSLGRAVGGLVSATIAHYLTFIQVFAGCALLCLVFAAVWLFVLHVFHKRRPKWYTLPENQQRQHRSADFQIQ